MYSGAAWPVQGLTAHAMRKKRRKSRASKLRICAVSVAGSREITVNVLLAWRCHRHHSSLVPSIWSENVAFSAIGFCEAIVPVDSNGGRWLAAAVDHFTIAGAAHILEMVQLQCLLYLPVLEY